MDTKNGSGQGKANIVPYGMEWLRDRLMEIGKTGAGLARALGIAKARVYEMQDGRRRLQQNEISTTARFLGWSEAQLLARIENRSRTGYAIATDEIGEIAPLRTHDANAGALVLFRTASGEKGRTGGFMIMRERAGEVVRPEFLRYSKNAFSATVFDDKNKPAYRLRDTILVDPDSPPVEGGDCLFTNDLAPAPGCHAVIGCLVSSTGHHWIIHQYAAKGDRTLSKSDYPHAWPIVGRYNRR